MSIEEMKLEVAQLSREDLLEYARWFNDYLDDSEGISLGTNPEFLALIERSRATVAAKGGISSDQMRRRFESHSTMRQRNSI